MAKKNAEADIKAAFDTIIATGGDEDDLSTERFDAEQKLLAASRRHPEICRRLLAAMSEEQRGIIAQALEMAAEMEDEQDEGENGDAEETEEALPAETPDFFELPEAELEEQIAYAFGFIVSSDRSQYTDAQDAALAFLRRCRRQDNPEFMRALGTLNGGHAHIVKAVLRIDA